MMTQTSSIRRCLIFSISILLLSACGGGGSSDDPPGQTTGGTTTNGQTTDGQTTDGTTTDGQTTDGAADSGLSHTGTRMPQGPNATLSDPLVSTAGRDAVTAISGSPAVFVEIVENHGGDSGESCKSLAAEFASCSVINLHLKDNIASLNDNEWKLFFHSIRRILRVDNDEFNVFHVNGDLHYLAPSDLFTGFTTETVKSIKLITEFNWLHHSDVMPRFWVSRDGQSAQIISNTNTADDELAYLLPITGDNRQAFNGEPIPIASTSTRYDRFSDVSELESVAELIIPTPSQMASSGETLAPGSISFNAGPLSADSINALANRLGSFYSGSGGTTVVNTDIDTSLASDTYRLTIDASGISIEGGSDEAVFHGAQSLLSLVTPGSSTLPYVEITDSPRFAWRGMHVDVARNFQSVAQLEKLIDQMAAYKLNTLHLHLTDDEGWRLQIPSLPELTSVGATRRFQLDADNNPTETGGLLPQLGSGPGSDSSATGFYTRAQFVSLLRYAAARYVSVVPEFDMPGHARAAVVAMRARAAGLGQPGNTDVRIDDPLDTSRYLTIQHYNDNLMNPCVAGTYNFIGTVVTDVLSMYTDAGVTLPAWHMGGDEAKNIFKGIGFQDQNDAERIPWKGDIDTSLYDFPWQGSPACTALIESDNTLSSVTDLSAYFVSQVATILNDAGVSSLYAWQDIMDTIAADSLAVQNTGIMYWDPVTAGGYSEAYEWPARGYNTVLAVPDFLYFDHPYEADPEERGYYWATRFTDTRKVFSFVPENLPQNAELAVTREGNAVSASSNNAAATFTGMQGHIWSETVRTPEQFDAMVFPRLLALAERAWHRAAWEIDYAAGAAYSASSGRTDLNALNADWNRFANAVGRKELAKLDAAGVNYRIPTVGVMNGTVPQTMITEFPGLTIEYSTTADGNFNAQVYDPAAAPSNAVSVRARSANGSRAGRITPITQ